MDPIFTALDLIAVGWFFITITGYYLVCRWTPLGRRDISAGVQTQRVRWMRNMAMRENRMLDAMLLGGLSQGNAFFASTSAIAIGGLAAIMGSGDQAQALLERIPYVARSPAAAWDVKVIFLMAVFVFAFFKFAWAFRLSHYTAIMMGATPLESEAQAKDRDQHADRTAALLGIAADHANSGLRSFYYAICGLAWFFHPILFIAATTWILIILIRRDFFSRSRSIINGGPI